MAKKVIRKVVLQSDVIRELYRAPATASELALALTMRKDVAQQILSDLCANNTIVCRPFYSHCAEAQTWLYMMPEHAPKERVC